MGCKVWVAASAAWEARRISRWWHKHRSAAPRLFDHELAHAIELIEAHPSIGTRTHHPVHGRVQFLLLPRTRIRVFYVFFPITDEAGIVYIRHARRRPAR